MQGAAASLQGVGVDTYSLSPYLHGVRRRAGQWTLAHAHQRPLSHPPQWRHWGPTVRTEGGDEDKEDSDALGTPERVLAPQGLPSLHSPLQCCRWRLSGGCTHSLQHKAGDSEEGAHRSTCLSDKGRSHSWVPLPP